MGQMTTTRLRPAHPPGRLAEIYATPHDHRRFGRGHGERVFKMMELVDGTTWGSAADLSCGNGVVLDSVDAPVKHYGDLAPGWPITGPLEQTLVDLPDVDLYVMGETLEHLDDPALVLRLVSARARWLLLSTPIGAWGDTNEEHYWAWDREGVEELIAQSTSDGAVVLTDFHEVNTRVYGEPYCYGVWLVKL
jgi:hypothetical protein